MDVEDMIYNTKMPGTLWSSLLLEEPPIQTLNSRCHFALDPQGDGTLNLKRQHLAMVPLHFLHSAIGMQDIHNFLCIS